MKKILFLNGEYSYTVDIIRVLKNNKKNITIHVLIKQKSYRCRSKYIDVFHFLPDNQNIVEFIHFLDKKHTFDMIFPVGIPEVEIFSREKEKFKNIYVDDFDIVAKTIFKSETLKIANNLGIPTPKSIVIHSRREIQDLEKYDFHLPLFVKSYKETEKRIRNVAKKRKHLMELCNEIFHTGCKPLIQEFISDPFTYGVGIYAEQGKIIKYFIHKEVLSYPPTGGGGVILTTFNDERLIFYTEKLIDFLKYSGFALVEFKYDSRLEDYVLMEINAKLWASIAFALPAIGDFFPFMSTNDDLSEDHIYLFPDRLILTFRYSPFKAAKWFFHFLFFKGKRKINFNKKDLKYEICKIFISFRLYIPSFIKKRIKKTFLYS